MRLTNLYILLGVLGLVVAVRLSMPVNLGDYPGEPLLAAPQAMQAVQVHHDSLALIANEGKAYFKDIPFTGFGVKHYDNGEFKERVAYVDGKREGRIERWYQTGQVSFRGNYVQNRRHGVVQTWWQNGTKRSESNYVEGVPHGVQRQWYQSGALFKELHLEHGMEAGLQRAWRENGKLYANYEAIDGRIFGLKRANLCYDLDGETIQLSIN